jgi:hypothetical protein
MSTVPAQEAKRVLFALGMELPGLRTIALAERLLAATSEEHGARIARAIAGIEDGAVALVAAEPELRCMRLPRPAMSVGEAADVVVRLLSERILAVARPARAPTSEETGQRGRAL